MANPQKEGGTRRGESSKKEISPGKLKVPWERRARLKEFLNEDQQKEREQVPGGTKERPGAGRK